MKRYLYVQAVMVNAGVGNPGAMSFRSEVVSAKDEETAYILGQCWAAATCTFRPTFETVNDYVREVGV